MVKVSSPPSRRRDWEGTGEKGKASQSNFPKIEEVIMLKCCNNKHELLTQTFVSIDFNALHKSR